MSFEISTAFKQQYANTVEMLAQQNGSKLRGLVSVGTYSGKAGQVVQQINSVVPQKKTSRHSDKPLISTPHDVRWCFPEDYEWADLIDTEDRLRTAADFDSPYAMNGAAAIGRVAIDDVIITNYFGTNKTGENGTTDTAFTGANQVAVNFGGSNVGLTYEKVREGLRLLREADVDTEMEPIIGVISPKQMDDLFGQTEAINQDFRNRAVVESGIFTQWMGVTWVVSTRLPQVTGQDYRRCMFFARSGMHLGIWRDINTNIAPRYDKFGDPMQVSVSGTFGATRVQEAKCIEIICDE